MKKLIDLLKKLMGILFSYKTILLLLLVVFLFIFSKFSQNGKYCYISTVNEYNPSSGILINTRTGTFVKFGGSDKCYLVNIKVGYSYKFELWETDLTSLKKVESEMKEIF